MSVEFACLVMSLFGFRVVSGLKQLHFYIFIFYYELIIAIYVYFGAVAQLVKVLQYKPEGCGFDSLWGHWNFSVT
jgi:hypothetical protein